MPTPQFLALAADKKRRLRRLKVERVTRPLTAALGKLLLAYCWGVVAVAALLCAPLALLAAIVGGGRA